MADCVFCKLVAKQIPASIVYEDDATLAFMDLGQVNPGHVLVAVKKHAAAAKADSGKTCIDCHQGIAHELPKDDE